MATPTTAGIVAAAQAAATGVAAVSLQAKIPDFWTDMPKSWFSQFETIMAPQKQGDTQLFEIAIARLSQDTVRQVTDIIEAPPESGKYAALKKRLVAIYGESVDKQFQRLIGEMDLGTQKPSQLYRAMAALAKNCNVTDEPLKRLWLNRLPPGVRAVLTVTGDTKLEDLAETADRVMENMGTGEVASIATSTSDLTRDTETDLVKHLSALSVEMKELRGEINDIRKRNGNPGRDKRGQRWQQGRYRPRSPSRPRRTPSSPDWLCRHHFRYRESAQACESPCNWSRRQQGAGN